MDIVLIITLVGIVVMLIIIGKLAEKLMSEATNVRKKKKGKKKVLEFIEKVSCCG